MARFASLSELVYPWADDELRQTTCLKPLTCQHKCKKPKDHTEECGNGDCPFSMRYKRRCGHETICPCLTENKDDLDPCGVMCRIVKKCGHRCRSLCSECDPKFCAKQDCKFCREEQCRAEKKKLQQKVQHQQTSKYDRIYCANQKCKCCQRLRSSAEEKKLQQEAQQKIKAKEVKPPVVATVDQEILVIADVNPKTKSEPAAELQTKEVESVSLTISPNSFPKSNTKAIKRSIELVKQAFGNENVFEHEMLPPKSKKEAVNKKSELNETPAESEPHVCKETDGHGNTGSAPLHPPIREDQAVPATIVEDNEAGQSTESAVPSGPEFPAQLSDQEDATGVVMEVQMTPIVPATRRQIPVGIRFTLNLPFFGLQEQSVSLQDYSLVYNVFGNKVNTKGLNLQAKEVQEAEQEAVEERTSSDSNSGFLFSSRNENGHLDEDQGSRET